MLPKLLMTGALGHWGMVLVQGRPAVRQEPCTQRQGGTQHGACSGSTSTWTTEWFQPSWIYYNKRNDKINKKGVINNNINNALLHVCIYIYIIIFSDYINMVTELVSTCVNPSQKSWFMSSPPILLYWSVGDMIDWRSGTSRSEPAAVVIHVPRYIYIYMYICI